MDGVCGEDLFGRRVFGSGDGDFPVALFADESGGLFAVVVEGVAVAAADLEDFEDLAVSDRYFSVAVYASEVGFGDLGEVVVFFAERTGEGVDFDGRYFCGEVDSSDDDGDSDGDDDDAEGDPHSSLSGLVVEDDSAEGGDEDSGDGGDEGFAGVGFADGSGLDGLEAWGGGVGAFTLVLLFDEWFFGHVCFCSRGIGSVVGGCFGSGCPQALV